MIEDSCGGVKMAVVEGVWRGRKGYLVCFDGDVFGRWTEVRARSLSEDDKM